MPFTPAHAAIAVPLARLFRRVPFVPLVVGTQVPDLPMLFPGLCPSYALTHAWAYGAPINLAYGVLAFLAYEWAKPALVALLSLSARERLADDAASIYPRAVQDWLGCAAAVIVGALTHLFWDAFTHESGAALRWLPVLGELWIGQIAGYKLLQYGSSILGLSFVIGWSNHRLLLLPRRADVAQRWREPVRIGWWVALVVLAPSACAFGSYLASRDDSAHAFAYRAITSLLAAELTLLLAARLLFSLPALRAR